MKGNGISRLPDRRRVSPLSRHVPVHGFSAVWESIASYLAEWVGYRPEAAKVGTRTHASTHPIGGEKSSTHAPIHLPTHFISGEKMPTYARTHPLRGPVQPLNRTGGRRHPIVTFSVLLCTMRKLRNQYRPAGLEGIAKTHERSNHAKQ